MGALEMLRSAMDFRQINAGSKTRVHPTLLVRYRRNELERSRFGISTGKRVGSAVVRNQVRRRLRTILRRLGPQVEPGWDILIVARAPAAQAAQAELDGALTRLMGTAGLLTQETTGTK